MNAKTLILMAGGTALLGGAALLMDSNRGGAAASDATSALVPELAERADDVSRIELVSGSGTLTLGRTESGWGLAARGGYPVEADKVRTLLAAYARADRLEPKTKNPDRYPDLGLADVDAEGSNSSRIRLLAGEGDLLGDVVVGKRRPTGAAAYYARIPGEAQTWLASGELRLATTRREWIDTNVAKIERKRVVGVEVTHPDGEVVTLERLEEADENLSLVNVPDGMVPSSDWITSRFGTALEFLTLEDIEPRAKRAGERTRSVFRTRDGLVLEFRTQLRPAEDGGTEQLLVDLTASYDENPPLPWAGPLAPGVEPVADLTAEEDASEEGARSPEEVRAEVEDLNARFQEWTLVLAGYRKNVFQVRMAELVKVEPTAEPPAEPAAGLEAPTAAGGAMVEEPPAVEPGHEGHDHAPGEGHEDDQPEDGTSELPQDEAPVPDPGAQDEPAPAPGGDGR